MLKKSRVIQCCFRYWLIQPLLGSCSISVDCELRFMFVPSQTLKSTLTLCQKTTALQSRTLTNYIQQKKKNVFCVCRKLTAKPCSCWTSRQCRSAWTWSWDQLLSCATTLKESSWRFISSLLRSWRGEKMDTVLIYSVNNPVKTLYFFSSTLTFPNFFGHPLKTCLNRDKMSKFRKKKMLRQFLIMMD